MIVNADQCDFDLVGTSLSSLCGIYSNVCKELCSNITNSSVKCNARIDDCFWLYNSNEGVEGAGSCKDKNDASLECAWVINGDQCKTGLEGTTLENDCFWNGDRCSSISLIANCSDLRDSYNCIGSNNDNYDVKFTNIQKASDCVWVRVAVGSTDAYCVDDSEVVDCQVYIRSEDCDKKNLGSDDSCTILGETVCVPTSSCMWEESHVRCVALVGANDEEKSRQRVILLVWIIVIVGLFVLCFLFNS
jgi:hypothetical protein